MRTFRKNWRKAALWLAGGVLALAVLAAGLNLTGAPLGLARGVARAIEEQSGWRIDVRGAHFSGLSHLRLTEVTARPPGAGAEIRLPAVDVAVDPWKVLTGRTEGAVHAVRLVRPRLVVEEGTWRLALAALPAGAAAGRGEAGTSRPEQTGGSGRSLRVEVVDGTVEEAAPGGSTVRAWRVDGRAELAGDGWSIAGEELRLRQVGGTVELTLRRSGGRASAYEFEAKGPAEFLLPLVGLDAWQVTGSLVARGELEVSGSAASPALRGARIEAEVRDGTLAWGERSDDQAAFERLVLEAESDGRVWRITSLALQRGAAAVRAGGEMAPGPGGSWEAQLTVSAEGLDLPRDLPVVQRFGLSGRGRFSGTVSGSLDSLVLSGTLSLENGTVWHRPVARGQGSIALSREGFRFDEAVLEQGTARYVLDGEVRWDRTPYHLAIELRAARGSLSELLKAFSLDVDAVGEVDGRLHLDGPAGAVRLEGDAAVRGVRIGGVRYFDRAEGRFSWQDGALALAGVRAELGEGTAALDGVLRADRLDLSVALDRWPVEAGSGPLASLASGVSGWVSYAGRLEGTQDEPRLSGQFLGGQLALGRLPAAAPVGAAVLTPEILELNGVSVTSVGGGRYTLNGTVTGWRTESPRLDLDIRVEEASFSGLLREGGLTWPALLIDGTVDGQLKVYGDAHRPDATFDLALGDDLGVGEPIRLQFGIEGGRLKLSRSALLSLMRAG